MGTRHADANATLVTTTTTGTGTYNLGSAVAGYFHPNDAPTSLNGLRVGYVVVDSLTAPTIREVGQGVLSSGTPWTLTRATIIRSLNAGVAGSGAINWSAGTKYIFLTALAGTVPLLDTDGWLHTAGALTLATNGAQRLAISDAGVFTFASPAAGRLGLETHAAEVLVGSWTGTFDLQTTDSTFFDMTLPNDTAHVIGAGFIRTDQTGGSAVVGVVDAVLLNASLTEVTRSTACLFTSNNGLLAASGLGFGFNAIAAGNTGHRIRIVARKLSATGPFNALDIQARILVLKR